MPGYARAAAIDAFFFQAEDGIRVFHVTGVQTCALPISSAAAVRASLTAAESGNSNAVSDARTAAALAWAGLKGAAEKIGRASCRERGGGGGGDGRIEREMWGREADQRQGRTGGAQGPE